MGDNPDPSGCIKTKTCGQAQAHYLSPEAQHADTPLSKSQAAPQKRRQANLTGAVFGIVHCLQGGGPYSLGATTKDKPRASSLRYLMFRFQSGSHRATPGLPYGRLSQMA